MFKKIRILPPLLLLLALSQMLVGCDSFQNPVKSVQPTATALLSASIPTILITAVDYGYAMPNVVNLPSGIVDFALINNGTQDHQAQVARLNVGVTRDEVVNELVTKKHLEAAFSLLTFVGGPDTIAPGYGQETMLHLSAGTYVMLCFVQGQDGVAHVDKGMLHFFTVSSNQGQETMPQVDGGITMKEFSYSLPQVITQSRLLTLQVSNLGTEPHEMNIIKLAQGKGVQDVQAFFRSPSGPPPFEELGGLATIDAGGVGWLQIHLEPGSYAVFSFILDQKTGKSQLSLGMIAPFTVQ